MDLDIEIITKLSDDKTQYKITDVTILDDQLSQLYSSKNIIVLPANGFLGLGAVPLFSVTHAVVSQQEFIAPITQQWTTTGAIAEVLVTFFYNDIFGTSVQKDFRYLLPLETNTPSPV